MSTVWPLKFGNDFITRFIGYVIDYLPMLGLKLIHVCRRCPRPAVSTHWQWRQIRYVILVATSYDNSRTLKMSLIFIKPRVKIMLKSEFTFLGALNRSNGITWSRLYLSSLKIYASPCLDKLNRILKFGSHKIPHILPTINTDINVIIQNYLLIHIIKTFYSNLYCSIVLKRSMLFDKSSDILVADVNESTFQGIFPVNLDFSFVLIFNLRQR